MTSEAATRDRLRAKQDTLLQLALGRGESFSDGMRIASHPGAPTLGQLRPFIHPDWELEIDAAIRYLKTGSW